ncbi:MAG TPA: hypothetical protein VFK60_11615 [Casimicrobiaceae bacterium]|nr:hypothetical protein [Casimicrobiaceae bacterium]
MSDLASAFERRLKYDHLLSAASTLLWLRRQSPIVIYDSRAVRALKRLAEGTDVSSYATYCDTWRTQFSLRKVEIESDSNKLHQFAAFTAVAHRGGRYIRPLGLADPSTTRFSTMDIL